MASLQSAEEGRPNNAPETRTEEVRLYIYFLILAKY